ncbi:MAG: hypothetical protein IRZ16_08025 [Myxococcaceae bacterium]|nr:hypothetical protein [Myxococcaceae bacterium]
MSTVPVKATFGVLAALMICAGCYELPPPPRPELTSFSVTVNGIYAPRPEPDGGTVQFGDDGMPIPVVQACVKKYGSPAEVPPAKRGTTECPYAIFRGEVEFDVTVSALGKKGEKLTSFTGPVSFRVVPGDLTGKYAYRTMQVTGGTGHGVVKVAHLYGEVRVWVSDAPPEAITDAGVVVPGAPAEPEQRTFATGISEPVWFEDPTLAKVQIPDDFDNRTSPFVGQFLTIGRPPEGGTVLRQSCPDDPEHDGKEAQLVVTGIDPSGFFVTDLTACRVKEQLVDSSGQVQVRVPEPDGFMPGTFGSMFIYNYSYPDGLDQGDLLWSVSGAVQEFTSTTQLTFPSWNIRDKVRTRPESEWNVYLSQVPIPELNERICGSDDKPEPFLTDILCGHNRRNMKIESLESALVRVSNVRFSDTFRNCDFDGDGEVPFFCEQKDAFGNWVWGECGAFDGQPSQLTETQRAELACNIECVTGQGDDAHTLCSEQATFVGFGQFIIELAGPGPAAAHFDESLPAKVEKITVGSTSVGARTELWDGADVRLYCDAPVHYRFGQDPFDASVDDPLLPAHRMLEHTLGFGEPNLELITDGNAPQGATCWASIATHVRINLITRDAVPELQPNCSESDPDAEKAYQCKLLHAARFDIVGHLRQVQPARPRWVILPRDKDDICCRPGEGLECPKPFQPCP